MPPSRQPSARSDQLIITLPNLGPKSAAMLATVGIRSESDLIQHGSLGAFALVREAGFNPSLNLLYALEGALTGQKWNRLSLERRRQLDHRANFKRDLTRDKPPTKRVPTN